MGSVFLGSVFLAYGPTLEREVALKVPHAGLLVHKGAKPRFLREARVAARLEHPNLVSIFDAGEVGGICFIASAYCAGPTLADWLSERSRPVPVRLAAQLLSVLANAMQHAHD